MSKEIDDNDFVFACAVEEQSQSLDDPVQPGLGERAQIFVKDGLDHVHLLGVVPYRHRHRVRRGLALIVPDLGKNTEVVKGIIISTE